MSLRIWIDPGVVQDYPALAVSLGVPDFATATATPAHPFPPAGYYLVRDCGGALTYFDGPLTPSQVGAIPACATDANAATLRSRASTALTNNAAYLALASPTQAQAVAQVAALTRQVDGLIRLALDKLDSITDS